SSRRSISSSVPGMPAAVSLPIGFIPYRRRGAAGAALLDVGEPAFHAIVDQAIDVFEGFLVLAVRVRDFPLPPPLAEKKCLATDLGNLTRDPGLVRVLHHQDQVRRRENRRRSLPGLVGFRVYSSLAEQRCSLRVHGTSDQSLQAG